MNDVYMEKLKEQLEIVLKGETNLLESAQRNNLQIERVEQQIRDTMAQGIIFGSGDQIVDLMMVGYWLGRKDQFFASMSHLFTKEVLEKTYAQICIKLGIQPKKLN